MKQRKIKIYGKTRIIRDIRTDDENHFFAYYAACMVSVTLDEETKWVYAVCTAQDGCAIVDGYVKHYRFGLLGATIDDGIRKCLENIFYEQRPPIYLKKTDGGEIVETDIYCEKLREKFIEKDLELFFAGVVVLHTESGLYAIRRDMLQETIA